MKTMKLVFAALFLFCSALSFESCQKDTNGSAAYVAPTRSALTFTVKTSSDHTVANALVRMADSRGADAAGNYALSGKTDEFGKVTFESLIGRRYYFYRVNASINGQPYSASGMVMTKTGEDEGVIVVVSPEREAPVNNWGQ